ncbi:hypothetical protein MMC29_006666 [Sticta canariensis]|nr:hypothetical protein [Sticta canariensis]
MANKPVSDVGSFSDLPEELVHIRDPRLPFPRTGDQEEQHLLNVQANVNSERSEWVASSLTFNEYPLTVPSSAAPSGRRVSTLMSENGPLAKVKEFLLVYNQTTAAGRQQIKKDITRTGPVVLADTDSRLVQSSGIRGKWQLEGWRYGVFLSTIAVTICLVAELIMLVCAMALNKPEGNKDGIGILFVGDCAKVERINILLAIPLNIIATVLVATIHAMGSYLSIGIPSIHNLLHSLSWKSTLWLSLVLATVPIHLLLNSAFFGALQANFYGVVLASNGWETENIRTIDREVSFNGSFGVPLDYNFTSSMWQSSSHDKMQRLSKDECFAQYSVQLQNTASNLVVVVKQDTGTYCTSPTLLEGHCIDACSNPFTCFELPHGVGLYLQHPFTGNAAPILNVSQNGWTSGILPQNNSGGLYLWSHSDYSSTVRTGQTCTSGKDPKAPDPWLLAVQLMILLIVIGCDIAKILAMSATLFMVSEQPLATLGDAIASFLERPDLYTRGCCLIQQEQARQICHKSPWRWQRWKSGTKHLYQHANKNLAQKLGPGAAVWQQKVTRWFSAPSKSRWAGFGIALGCSAFCITCSPEAGDSQGFGSINPNVIFTYPDPFSTIAHLNFSVSNTGPLVVQTNKSKTLFADIITANTPQLLFSTLYFVYNGMFTSKVTAAEWMRFTTVRKSLRVSKPSTGQRSTLLATASMEV